MAGLDISEKLRRSLGNGKPVPSETIAKLIAPYDSDKDGGVTKEEFAKFLASAGVGGRWFCELVAKTAWQRIEVNFSEPVTWIKIDLLAITVAEFMKLKPRPPKRIAITPAGAQGWEPLYYLDGTPVANDDGSVPDVPPGPNHLLKPSTPPAPNPVSPAKFKASNEPFTRPPQAARQPPAPAPRPGPRPPAAAARPVTSAPGAAPPRTPTAAPTRPGPRRPGPRR
ncbi:MAG: EF-hand domain-containing protein [Myxococcota bacterium]